MEVPTRVRALVAALVVTSAALLSIAGPRLWLPPFTLDTVILCIVLIVFIVVADFFDVDLPLSSVRVTVSVSSALCFASALTLGPMVGALVAGVGALLVELIQRRPAVKLFVNISNYVITTFAAGWVYTTLADLDLTPIGSIKNLAVMISAGAVCATLSSWIIATVLSQVVGTSAWRVWKVNMQGVAFEGLTLPTLGCLVPVLNEQSPLALLIIVIPLLGPYLAFRSYRQIHQETRQTIELLADMLDRRDAYTFDHSHRVAEYTQQIIDELDDISYEDAEIIIAAARIHDLGKIGTSDAILLKPGKLTSDERLMMEAHATDGADILSNLSMYRHAAAIVRHHHERWDGQGYPDRLTGTAIPLGARIIAVADTYDSMTSDRVYRRALPHQVAMAELRRNAGTQFDPEVVGAFERACGSVPQPAEIPALRPVSPD